MKKLILLLVFGAISFVLYAQLSVGVLLGGKKALFLNGKPCLIQFRDSILSIEKQTETNKCQQPENKNVVALNEFDPKFKCQCYSVFKKDEEGFWILIQDNTTIIWIYDIIYPK
jgi:hypothetical protein